jgi:ubiquitin C-terminal hydrolase
MSHYKRKSIGSNTYQNNSYNSFNKSNNNYNNYRKSNNYKNKNLSSYYSNYTNKNISINYPLNQKTIQPITIDINSNYFNQKNNKSLTNNRGEYTYRSITNNPSLNERKNDNNFLTLNNRKNHSIFERVETNSKFRRNKTKSISYIHLPNNLDGYNDNNNATTSGNIHKNIKQAGIPSNTNKYFQNIKYAKIDSNINKEKKSDKSHLIPKGNQRYNNNNNQSKIINYRYKKEDNHIVLTEVEQNGRRKNIIHYNGSGCKQKVINDDNDDFQVDNLKNKNKSSRSILNSPISSRFIKKEESLFDVIYKEIGINNLGNTCFINACLQILIHCPLFIYKLIKIENEKLINEKTPTTSNFLSICKMMMETQENSIDISSFKNLLALNHKLFEGYLQNDSQEFCRILLEDISRELNEIKTKSIYKMLNNSDRKSKQSRDEDFHKNFTQREKSIITDIFYAQIVNIFTCECKAEIYSFQKILDFPLLFPENINRDTISINELLKLYFQTENIDFESKCERCHKISSHKKEIKISRPPEILILSLQRIDEKQEKLGYKVKFPQILDIYPYIDHDCGYDRESKYNLFGTINHVGNIDYGHYFSFIKIGNKNWYQFNDHEVNNIKKIGDCSEEVYALFYLKQKYNNPRVFLD